MPNSLSDAEVKTVLADARAGRAKMFPSPDDWRTQVIYQVMVDRFNNPAAPPRYEPYNAPYGSYQGGTYAGVQEKLSYLKELGVTTLWVTPVLKNCPWDTDSYHGYGIHNFLKAEPRFAVNPECADEELRALVDAAHEHGIYVVFDIVLHHTGNVFAYVTGNDSGNLSYANDSGWSDQPIDIRWRNERGEPNVDWQDAPAEADLNAAIWPSELRRNDFFMRRGTYNNDEKPQADFYALKSFNTEFVENGDDNKPVYRLLTEAYKYVIARFDIDGFRIDTLKFVSSDFESYFTKAIRDFAREIGKKNFILYGEVWADEKTIANFLARGGHQNGKMIGVDAVQDYPLFSVLPAALKGLGPTPSDLARVFEERYEIEQANIKNEAEVSKRYITFLDNHDVPQRFDYTGDSQNIDQIVAGLACLMSISGIPSIYYGTEQGLQGHKDGEHQDDSMLRESLWGKENAFDSSHPLYKALAVLTKLRISEPALTGGSLFMRPISGDGHAFAMSALSPGVLVYSRIIDDEEVVFAANLSGEGAFLGYTIVDGNLDRAGTQFELLYSNKRAASDFKKAVTEGRAEGDITIQEVKGGETHGPAVILPIGLEPFEAQILKRKGKK